MDRTVEDVVAIDTAQVFSTAEDTPLRDALELLKVHSTIPILNERLQVVACLSFHDMRMLYGDLEKWCFGSGPSLQEVFAMTVKQFLSRPTSDGSYYRTPVCVDRHATIQDAVQFMLDWHVHNIFVVDKEPLEGVCRGSLTLTDIILAAQDQNHVWSDLIAQHQAPKFGT
jgi:CBS-domain-containing membrane protein